MLTRLAIPRCILRIEVVHLLMIFFFFLIISPNLITQIFIIIFTCLLSRARGLLETIKRLLIKTPSYILNYKNKDPIYKQN